MRSVRLSGQMRYEIKANAEKAFEKANKIKPVSDEFGHLVRTAVMGIGDFIFAHKFIELIEAHKQKYKILDNGSTSGEVIGRWYDEVGKHSVEKIQISTNFVLTPLEREKAGLHEDEESRVSTTVVIDLATPLSVPFGKRLFRARSWNSMLTFAVNSSQFEKEDREKIEAYIKERWIADTARRKKKEKYTANVNRLVEGTNSTKQLLSRLPAAEAWIPEWVIQKMHEDAPKRTTSADTDQMELDDSLLKTTTLTARLLSSGGQDSA